jgi:hypothetical protein
LASCSSFLFFTAAIAVVGERFGDMIPEMEMLVQILNSVLSLALITQLFAMISNFYRTLKSRGAMFGSVPSLRLRCFLSEQTLPRFMPTDLASQRLLVTNAVAENR